MVIEVGVQVPSPFAGEGDVRESHVPGGRAAVTTHVGPYDKLDDAAQAVMGWLHDQGLGHPSLDYEVYGDWEDDPAKQTTELVFLLRGGGA